MAQYIDKDDLVTEIERQQRRCDILRQSNDVESRKTAAIQNGVYCYILSFLNTLEVKEVDLDDYYHKFLEKEWFGKHCNRTISEMMAFTAKHFFELGLKAQKGE